MTVTPLKRLARSDSDRARDVRRPRELRAAVADLRTGNIIATYARLLAHARAAVDSRDPRGVRAVEAARDAVVARKGLEHAGLARAQGVRGPGAVSGDPARYWQRVSRGLRVPES